MTIVRQDLRQSPAPGSHQLAVHGDTVSFELRLPGDPPGQAWLRTNLGRADIRHREIIDFTEQATPILARDWHDLPMHAAGPGRHALTLPLHEVGCFDAKTFFLPAESDEPWWPDGPNVALKVEPAGTAAANAIYTAFVRQFRTQDPAACNELENGSGPFERLGYSVIPPSGTFRELARRLDFIIGALRFRIVQLLPIFPTPTTYARMGRFGSPFAALDFMDVDPALAEFDRRTTPIEQFRELADAIHARGARLYLDIPINHTGWASWLQNHHPAWFKRNHDRTFHSPGAWGVTWEDLSELDYRHPKLWNYMADVFRFWCRQGVDGFRCDAGYMVPVPVWTYIVASVREAFPDTVFLLEGLGGKLEVTEALLGSAGLNWAYSEIFQTYDRNSFEQYLPYCFATSASRGLLVHFAETHDNNRLAATSPTHARMRTALAALSSEAGGFGITNGVEWLAREKVDVHGAPALAWGSADNQVAALGRLNALLAVHPAFHSGARSALIQQGGGNVLVMARRCRAGAHLALVLVNLDTTQPVTAHWPTQPDEAEALVDLLTGQERRVQRGGGASRTPLDPGQVLCLSPDPAALRQVTEAQGLPPDHAESHVEQRRVRAKALDIHVCLHPRRDAATLDLDALAQRLRADPRACCAKEGSRPPVAVWQWPRDLTRTVLVPPGHFLLVQAPHRFTADLLAGDTPLRREESLPDAHGGHFALFLPRPAPARPETQALALAVYGPGPARRERVELLRLADWEHTPALLSLDAARVRAAASSGLCTNGRGAMALANADWGAIRSQYHALLAANLHPAFPVDRHIMLTRCRAWLVYRDYSHELNAACQTAFTTNPDGSLQWDFAVPAGQGKVVPLSITLALEPGCNRIRLACARPRHGNGPDLLTAAQAVTLVVRPDIEDRNFHAKTKAYTGAEGAFPAAVHAVPGGFRFQPAPDRALTVTADRGTFGIEPQWQYMLAHPFEAQRGQDGSSDLFSPGYFALELAGGDTATLTAAAATPDCPAPATPATPARPARHTAADDHAESLEATLRRALAAFVVKRDDSLTVIAGYPWFLDWGRDTLISLRGLIAAGLLKEARDILYQFARFERQGTLPNMIRGGDDSNRDTSDAPLWFFVACADLLDHLRAKTLLDLDCAGRPLSAVLASIAAGYRKGTPNGIRMDPASGLIFSPSHFTWMDTNFPACSPREGYPIEIQALWHAALGLLARIDPGGDWLALQARVGASIARHYVRPGQQFLADCLHARPGTPAAAAEPDDALRPNQLFAVTLGALTDPRVREAVLASCEELIVPGALRSLADRPVRRHLPVSNQGRLLNNPGAPYWGEYGGDEDTRRKPAYHNGTAWTWPFPSYVEGLHQTYGAPVRATALAILSSSAHLLNTGCLGHLPEILDGNAPHAQRGCCAQAWSVTELYRVARLLLKT